MEGKVHQRLDEVAKKHAIDEAIMAYWHKAVKEKGARCVEVIRALANAIDTEDDATAAAIHDLKEESAAYRRGLKDGRRQGCNELFDKCLETAKKNCGSVFREWVGPTAELVREGESIRVRTVETPAGQVKKERETMQLIKDLQWLASQIATGTFAPSEMTMAVFRVVMPKAREAILEYERDRTERLSGPDGR